MYQCTWWVRTIPTKIAHALLCRSCYATENALSQAFEVYQELLHRYAAIRRWTAIDDAFKSLDGIVDEVLSFDLANVRNARA